jgi:hypothetical protein
MPNQFMNYISSGVIIYLNILQIRHTQLSYRFFTVGLAIYVGSDNFAAVVEKYLTSVHQASHPMDVCGF